MLKHLVCIRQDLLIMLAFKCRVLRGTDDHCSATCEPVHASADLYISLICLLMLMADGAKDATSAVQHQTRAPKFCSMLWHLRSNMCCVLVCDRALRLQSTL